MQSSTSVSRNLYSSTNPPFGGLAAQQYKSARGKHGNPNTSTIHHYICASKSITPVMPLEMVTNFSYAVRVLYAPAVKCKINPCIIKYRIAHPMAKYMNSILFSFLRSPHRTLFNRTCL